MTYDNYDVTISERLNSIEMLDVPSNEPWILINTQIFVEPCYYEVFCPINETQLVIIGGSHVTLFDVEEKTTKVVTTYHGVKWQYRNRPIASYVCEGEIVLIPRTWISSSANSLESLLSFSLRSNTF